MTTIGRNDPCHCGSGKKYKKCCLAKDQADAHPHLQLVSSNSAATGMGQAAPVAPAKAVQPTKKKTSIADIRSAIERKMEWRNQLDQILAKQLVKAMEPEYDQPLIMEAVTFWNGYSLEMSPIYQKYGSFCAAVEYYIDQKYGFPVSQSDLAAKYKVSTATVSKRFQDLLDYEMILDLQDDFRNAAPLPMSMERGMRSLELAIKDQQFETQAEAEAFIRQWMMNSQGQAPGASNRKRDNREEAQDLLYSAEEASTEKKRVQLAKQALKLHPNSPDAYRILAESANTEEESIQYLLQGIQAGERDLGPEYFKETMGRFWMAVETRPYMRVKYAYAHLSYILGKHTEAARHFEDILELNTNDNLGARHILITIYLILGRLPEAEKLLHTYEEDSSAAYSYSRLILEYKRSGISAKLPLLLRNALQSNPHVPAYLTGKRRIPKTLPDYIGMGDENEAIDYAAIHSQVWINLSELLQWMSQYKP